MQKLVDGIHQFQSHIFRSDRDFFERLADGQSPDALFITCSDSRVNPNLITQTRPGELFILRNAGNIVPPHGAGISGTAATIEYAVARLGVNDIIVCGHSHCGAMQGLLDPDALGDLPAMRGWLGHAEDTLRVIRENYGEFHDDALLNATVQENVLVQLDNVRTHPAVATRLARGDLHLHGWVYMIESGEVFAFDPAAGQFVPLTAVTTSPPKARRTATAI
jgi:carbonic anhydrase